MMTMPLFLRHTALMAGVCLLLSGCSTKGEPVYQAAELEDFEATSSLASQWSTRVGDGLGHARYPITPARDGDLLFSADVDGKVAAFTADSGERQWRLSLDDGVSSALTAVAGEVYLATRNGKVLALDQETGEVQWQAEVSSEVLAAPQANRRLLVVQSTNGGITAFNRNTGDVVWTYKASLPSLTLRSTGTPRVIDPVTFAGFANGRLVTLDNRDGSVIWQRRIADPSGRSDVDRLVDVAAQPLVTPDGNLYVTSYNGRLAAFDAVTGEMRWARELSSRHPPVLVASTLFVVTDNSHVLSVDADTGDTNWRVTGLEGRWLTAPVFADGRLAVGDNEGYLHLLSALEGKMVGRTRADRSGISVPVIADGRTLHVLTNKGRLNTLEISP